MKIQLVKNIALALCLMLAASVAVLADDKSEQAKASEESAKAAEAFREIMGAPDKAIPREVLDAAECIAVFPNSKKGAFILGVQKGDGVASCRTGNGWSAPAFFTITGGSWGAQIGAAAVDLVLVFVGNKGAEDLLNNNVKISGDLTVAAGPFGRTAQASTDMSIKAEILAYSKARGLFAGAELGGSSVRSDDDSNRALYGRVTTSKEVLSGQVQPPAGSEQFMSTLRKDFREAVNAH